MATTEEKTTTTEKSEVDTKTNAGKVYNFTRHNFVVVAKSRKEAEEALAKHLKETKEAK